MFNLHSQFEALREHGTYEKMRAAITERDIAFSGSRNPMLKRHGEASGARQYSGRQGGPVGRGDPSEIKHATAHFHETQPPVMRAIEPGEAWRWCFVDEVVG